jgi:hypothetical protein
LIALPLLALRVADTLGIVVVAATEQGFEILNPQIATAEFQELFSVTRSSIPR